MKETNDRAVISLGRKLPVEQYGNVEIRVEYEGKDFSSVEKLTVREFERLVNLIEKGKIKIGGAQ